MSTTTQSEQHTHHGRHGRGCGSHAGGKFAGPWALRHVPVNIEETADAFILCLYAAGLDRNGLRVSVQGDVLRIRHEAPQADQDSRKFSRRELPPSGFEREFALNGKVQTDAVNAVYADGVLTVRLPKTPDAQQPERQVPVQ